MARDFEERQEGGHLPMEMTLKSSSGSRHAARAGHILSLTRTAFSRPVLSACLFICPSPVQSFPCAVLQELAMEGIFADIFVSFYMEIPNALSYNVLILF